jgi:hypothetical protein
MRIKTLIEWLASEGAPSASTRDTYAPAVQETTGHPESLPSARFAKRLADMRRQPGLKPLRSPRKPRSHHTA